MKIPGYTKVQLFTSDDIGDFFGYVYLITNNENGRQYIGRKYFGSSELLKVKRK